MLIPTATAHGFLALLAVLAQAPAGAPTPAGKTKAPAPVKTAAAPAPPAGTLTVTDVVDRMQKRYETATDFRARVAQKYTVAATGREKLAAGDVLIKKPGRMRWNFESPERMYLANGPVFWFYQAEDKQVIKSDLASSQLPAAVSFLMGKGKLAEEFEISFDTKLPYGDGKDHRLLLKPKKPQSTYKAIYFVVDPESFLVRQSVLIDVAGNINAFTFTEPKINTKLPDSLFKWSPPQGVKVVDSGKLGK